MKNLIETKNLSLRIPSDMAHEIDVLINFYSAYTNRPDFVLAAMRFMDEWLFKVFYTNIQVVVTERKEEFISSKDYESADREIKEILDWLRKGHEGKTEWHTNFGFKEYAGAVIKSLWEEYKNYSGSPQLILVRIPGGIECPEWYAFTDFPTTIQDYARISLIQYIHFIECRGMIEHIARIIDGRSPTSMPEEQIRYLFNEKNKVMSYFGMLYGGGLKKEGIESTLPKRITEDYLKQMIVSKNEFVKYFRTIYENGFKKDDKE